MLHFNLIQHTSPLEFNGEPPLLLILMSGSKYFDSNL